MNIIDRLISKKIEEYKSFESKLKNVANVSLSETKKKKLKRNILMHIDSRRSALSDFAFAGLIARIREIGNSVSPSGAFRYLLKEKLLTLVEFNWRKFFSLRQWVFSHRKAFVSLFTLIFAFSIVFNFTFDIGRVEASMLTTLESFDGQVFIIRDAQYLQGEAGMSLKVDDIIKTGSGSKAVIRFLDQSVSRLDADTEIKISKLFVNPANRTETSVELVLSKGRVWARVISLIDDISSFQIKTKNTVAVAKKKAAFDVSLSSKGNAKVSAVQNRVDIVVATDQKVVETTLVKGFSAEVKDASPSAGQVVSEIAPDQPDSWIADNLAQDKQYIENVKQENKDQIAEQVQVLPGNPLYMMKEISEVTNIALTMDEADRYKKILIAAQEKFSEAQVLLQQGNIEKANSMLGDFKSKMEEIFGWVRANKETNTTAALEVESVARGILKSYEKQFSIVLPTDPLYPVKQLISDTMVSVAGDSKEKTEQLLSQAGNKLLEAHDLVELGDTQAAKTQIEEYSKAISNMVTEVSQMSDDAKAEAVGAILDKNVDDLKVLQAFEMAPAVEKEDSKETAGSTTVIELREVIGTTTIFGSTTTGNGGSTTAVEMLQPASPVLTADSPIPAGSSTIELGGNSAIADPKALKEAVANVKTETLTAIGKAVLEVHQTDASTEVLKKIENIKDADVNGKQLVDMKLTKSGITIKSNGELIPVTLQKSNSGTPVSPPKQQ